MIGDADHGPEQVATDGEFSQAGPHPRCPHCGGTGDQWIICHDGPPTRLICECCVTCDQFEAGNHAVKEHGGIVALRFALVLVALVGLLLIFYSRVP